MRIVKAFLNVLKLLKYEKTYSKALKGFCLR